MTPPPPQEEAPWVVRPTPRQLEVLTLIAAGATLDDAARALGLSRETVRNHANGARRRLKAKNLPQAVAECLVRGWLVRNR